MEDFKDRFITDALELLSKLEKNLLMLEDQPENNQIVEEIFRDLHSLKGASGMYGFDNIGKLMHLIENVYDGVREKKISVNTELINLSLDVIDYTYRMLKLKSDSSTSSKNEFKTIEQQINYYLFDDAETNIDASNEVQENNDKDKEKTFYVSFTINEDFDNRGISLDSVFKQLDKLGSVVSIPIKSKKKNQNAWEIFIVSKSTFEDVEDVFIFMMDLAKIELLASENLFLNDEFNSIVQKNAALKQQNNFDDLNNIIAKTDQKKESFVEKNDSINAPELQENSINFLKVASEKLDEQMDLLSELVTAKAELRLIVEQEGYKKLTKLIESVDKITNRFRKNILNVRLVQIKTLYVMFLRLIRDISKRLGKDVEFVTNGLETEFDKNIIDSLESPLTHLLRNSLDHGVETTEERIKLGKPVKAKIEFNTYRSGSDIIIKIKDDGRGMDKEKIRNKAIEKGLITVDTELSDKQLYDLIFMPGFSTAQNLSEVSGRGVGMDVVKKSISQLRGDVEIQSEQGKGTTVTIKLPMSLSIIDTLLVQSGKQFFSIPLPDIQKCTLLTQAELEQSANNQLNIEDKLIPYINLRKIFNINGQVPISQKVVIVKNEEQEVGLVVDKVIGEYQAVLKPFDGYLINQHYLTGASLLADGHLCVILDTAKLIADSNDLAN